MRIVLFLSALLFAITGCETQTPENAETGKRIAACQDVMKLYITQTHVYERDRKRLIGSCHISQNKRTLEQWQCTLAAMRTGEKYDKSSEKCGAKGVVNP